MPKLRKRIRDKLFAPCRSRHDASSNQPARPSRRQLGRRKSCLPDPLPATVSSEPKHPFSDAAAEGPSAVPAERPAPAPITAASSDYSTSPPASVVPAPLRPVSYSNLPGSRQGGHDDSPTATHFTASTVTTTPTVRIVPESCPPSPTPLAADEDWTCGPPRPISHPPSIASVLRPRTASSIAGTHVSASSESTSEPAPQQPPAKPVPTALDLSPRARPLSRPPSPTPAGLPTPKSFTTDQISAPTASTPEPDGADPGEALAKESETTRDPHSSSKEVSLQSSPAPGGLPTPAPSESEYSDSPATRPTSQHASRPHSRPASRPQSRPASRPQSRPASRPPSQPEYRPPSPPSRPPSQPTSLGLSDNDSLIATTQLISRFLDEGDVEEFINDQDAELKSSEGFKLSQEEEFYSEKFIVIEETGDADDIANGQTLETEDSPRPEENVAPEDRTRPATAQPSPPIVAEISEKIPVDSIQAPLSKPALFGPRPPPGAAAAAAAEETALKVVRFTKEQNECLQSLAATTETKARRASEQWDISPTAAASPGTCGWCFETDAYRTWQTRGGLLCVKGKPGAGKSALMKRITSQFLQQTPDASNCVVASFSFNGVAGSGSSSAAGAGSDGNDAQQKAATAFLYAIVNQLAQQSDALLAELTDIYERNKDGGPGAWDLSETELQDLLFKHARTRPVAARAAGRLWIFIDDIDEAGDAVAKDLVEYLAQLARPAGRGERSPVGVCLSCRNDSPATQGIALQLRVEDSNAADIISYVRRELTATPVALTPGATDELARFVARKAQNVFLWAFLVVEMIRRDWKQLPVQQIRKRVEQVPGELDDIYREKLGSVVGGERVEALRLLQWVCFATRPLTLKELRIALVLDPERPERSLSECFQAEDYVKSDDAMEEAVVRRSRGLLQVVTSSSSEQEQRTVQPIHRSVKEFLLHTGLHQLYEWPIGTNPQASELFLSQACLRYMEFPEYHRLDPLSLPFGTYVTFNWYRHAERHSTDRPDLLEFFHTAAGERLFRMWWATLGRAIDLDAHAEAVDDRLTEALMYQRGADDFTVFHLAAACGWFGTIGAALTKIAGVLASSPHMPANGGPDGDEQQGAGERTLLHWAAFSGSEHMVEFFLKRGDIDAQAADTRGQTALHIAVIQGHVKIVARLLKKVAAGGPGKAVLNRKDEDGRAAVHYAAILGRGPIVALLLAEPALDVNARDGGGQTPLFAPVKAGNAGIVRLLCGRKDLDVNARDRDGRSALHLAVTQRKQVVARLLLDRADLDVNARHAGCAPLMTAVRRENVAMVRLLVERADLDVNAKRDGGYGPLMTAVSMNGDDVVRVLLSRPDLDVNSRGERWRTPLSVAVGLGNEAIVRLLVGRPDLDMNARDEDGCTPLMDAIASGNEKIVGLMLSRGDTDVYGRSVSGFMLLAMAEDSGNDAIVQLLRKRCRY